MNHCNICGNNIPEGKLNCEEAGFGEGCGKTMRTMNQDKLREEFDKWYLEQKVMNPYIVRDYWLTKMQEREEEIIYEMRKASLYFLKEGGKKVVGVTQRIMLNIIRNQK